MTSTNFLQTKLVCFGVMLVLGTVGLTAAAERTVLGEFISSDFCSDCQLAAPVVSGLVDSYPEFAIIGVHFGDPYWTDWGNARQVFYSSISNTTPVLRL